MDLVLCRFDTGLSEALGFNPWHLPVSCAHRVQSSAMTMQTTKITAGPLPLLCILALALALRLWGITWGLPSATHYFSYHPDESVMLETSSVTMNVFAGHLLPHFYNYGSLQLYLVCFASTLAALFGAVDIVPKNFDVWYPQWGKMYLIGRLLTVGMGVGTVWATYAVGATLWGRRAGLFAALILAITPLHAQHSHFLTVDVPATFWVMLSLLWSAKLATDAPKPLKAAILAGLFAGLAAATKYNMALVLLPALAACYLNSSPSRFGRVAACCGVGLLAFCAACPGALLETSVFLKDIRFEAVHVQNSDDPTFRNTGNGFVYHITHNLDAGLGLPLLLLALSSIVYALYRRERGDALLAAFALPYYILISLAAVRYARYVIPLLPILALWTGRMLADRSRIPESLPRRVAVSVAGLFVLATLANAVSLLSGMTGVDTRDQALAWLDANKPTKIGFAVQPWFGTAPVSPYFTMPRPGGWQKVTPPDIKQRIFYSGTDWDINALKAQKPEVVVLSEYDYDDAVRLHTPEAEAYIAELRRDYPASIEMPPAYSHMPTHLASLPTRGLPHDMTYPSPQIVICVRGDKRKTFNQ